MYDPLVVDTFVRVKDQLDDLAPAADESIDEALHNKSVDNESMVEAYHRVNGALSLLPELSQELTVFLSTLIESSGARFGVFYVRTPRAMP